MTQFVIFTVKFKEMYLNIRYQSRRCSSSILLYLYTYDINALMAVYYDGAYSSRLVVLCEKKCNAYLTLVKAASGGVTLQLR